MADTYGDIARARATMMVRGHLEPELHIGRETLENIKRDLGPGGPFDHSVTINAPLRMHCMPVVIRGDMEGWAVMPG